MLSLMVSIPALILCTTFGHIFEIESVFHTLLLLFFLFILEINSSSSAAQDLKSFILVHLGEGDKARKAGHAACKAAEKSGSVRDQTQAFWQQAPLLYQSGDHLKATLNKLISLREQVD